MNKSLIIFALIATLAFAKLGFKNEMFDNASNQKHEIIKTFLDNENLTVQQLEEFAKENNIDLEKLQRIKEFREKKNDNKNIPDLTEEQITLLKEKF